VEMGRLRREFQVQLDQANECAERSSAVSQGATMELEEKRAGLDRTRGELDECRRRLEQLGVDAVSMNKWTTVTRLCNSVGQSRMMRLCTTIRFSEHGIAHRRRVFIPRCVQIRCPRSVHSVDASERHHPAPAGWPHISADLDSEGGQGCCN
jgi:hypothetical protein